MALLAALLFASSRPLAQAQTAYEILRDCQDDGILQGDYSAAADARRAQQHPDRARRVLRLPRRAHARHRGEDVVEPRATTPPAATAAPDRRRHRPAAATAPAAAAPTPDTGSAQRRRRPRAAGGLDSGRERPDHAAGMGRDQRGAEERRPRSPTTSSRSRPARERLTADVGRNGAARHAHRRAGPDRRRRARARRRPLIRKTWPGSPPDVGRTSRRRRAERCVPAIDVPLPPAGADGAGRRRVRDPAVRVRRARRDAARAHDVDLRRADARGRRPVRARARRPARVRGRRPGCAASGCSARSRC